MRRLGMGLSVVVVVVAGCASSAPPKSADQGAGVPKGYHLVVKHGTDYYCKWESVTGSHTQKSEVCFTEEELAEDRNHGLTVGHNPSAGS